MREVCRKGMSRAHGKLQVYDSRTTPRGNEHSASGGGKTSVADEAEESEAESSACAVTRKGEFRGIDGTVFGSRRRPDEVEIRSEGVGDCPVVNAKEGLTGRRTFRRGASLTSAWEGVLWCQSVVDSCCLQFE